MATKQGPPGGGNMYSWAKNNPEVLEKRKQRHDELDRQVERLLKENPGRAANWEPERLLQLDRFVLQNRKRCIMWDDDGTGFFLMLNWDWLNNRPAHPATADEALDPGWWQNVRKILRAPLLDPDVPEEKLAGWIDEHTMRCHAFLDRLHLLRDGGADGMLLDDEYGRQLAAVGAEAAAPEAGAASGEAA